MHINNNIESIRHIISKIGDYIKYIPLLQFYVSKDGSINFPKFNKEAGPSGKTLSVFRNKLKEVGFLKQDTNKQWYLNPICDKQKEYIPDHLYLLFKEELTTFRNEIK